MFRVVIFSSGTPFAIARLAERIHREVPDARVCGVLLERKSGKSLGKRVAAFAKKLTDANFLRYASGRVVEGSFHKTAQAGTALLRFIHAARPEYPPNRTLSEVCASLGCEHFVTTDCHGAEALNFVRALNADLGLVYGTRILKPCLFTIPKLGSINIHKRKVPDYRGGGPVGLWEMLDGQREIGVTVHEVEEKLDAGAVINAQTIAIEPFDNLTSLALKAHVVANDLLVKSVADYSRNAVTRTSQAGKSRMFKSPTPQQLLRYEVELAGKRPGYKAKRGRSIPKLLAKSALGLPSTIVRNRIRRSRGSFPVMILFHHLVADRHHMLGMSTEHFMRHVEFLRTHYQVVSLSEAIGMLRSKSVSRPTVVLTVDDGYGENFLTLRAIRERLDVPITLFVSTEIMNRQGRFPHDVRHGNEGWNPLTWDQLRQMQREGFEIGSHTRTHFDCGSTDVNLLLDEIAGSKDELQRQLGIPIELFSFPFGLPANISEPAMEIACGTYSYVFSAYGGSNFVSADGEVKHLRRWAHPNDIWELALTLQGVLEAVPAPIQTRPHGLSDKKQVLRAAS